MIKSNASILTLVIGVIFTVVVSVVVYICPAPREQTALLIGLVGLCVTLILELRVKQGEFEDIIEDGVLAADRAKRILENSRTDPIFAQRYQEIQSEIDELSAGQYRIRSLNALYQDDIRSITSLYGGERLLSTCPVSSVSQDTALQQISEAHYVASIKAHLAAVNRGVHVTRLYLFKNRDNFDCLKQHLIGLRRQGMAIKIIFRNETVIDSALDFLVFGERKVSVGEIDIETGMVKGARVYTDKVTVSRYAKEYEDTARLALNIDQFPA